MSKSDAYFSVSLSTRWRKQLEALEDGTLYTKPTILGLLIQYANIGLLQQLARQAGELGTGDVETGDAGGAGGEQG